jgi:hypothetical protein
MMGVASPITTGCNRRGYAVLHRCVPAAGIVLVIGIVAYVFIFILETGWRRSRIPAT